MNIIISEIKDSDVTRVVEIIRQAMIPSLVHMSEQEQSDVLKKYDENLLKSKIQKGKYFIAKDSESKIYGIIGLIDSEVRTFYVTPLFQGNGIGRMLFEKLRTYAKSLGNDSLIVKSSPEAKEIYETLGFIVQNKVLHEKGNFYNYNMSLDL